jgi:hypothetical protein
MTKTWEPFAEARRAGYLHITQTDWALLRRIWTAWCDHLGLACITAHRVPRYDTYSVTLGAPPGKALRPQAVVACANALHQLEITSTDWTVGPGGARLDHVSERIGLAYARALLDVRNDPGNFGEAIRWLPPSPWVPRRESEHPSH